MSFEFKRTSGEHKSRKKICNQKFGTKFPRHKIDMLDQHLPMKKLHRYYTRYMFNFYRKHVDYSEIINYLRARVGQPWDTVLSKLIEDFGGKNEVRKNSLYKELDEYLGIDNGRYWRRYLYDHFYIDDQGILQANLEKCPENWCKIGGYSREQINYNKEHFKCIAGNVINPEITSCGTAYCTILGQGRQKEKLLQNILSIDERRWEYRKSKDITYLENFKRVHVGGFEVSSGRRIFIIKIKKQW